MSTEGASQVSRKTLEKITGVMKRHLTPSQVKAIDEGGIVCHIVPSDGREALVVSLTHLRMPRTVPLASAVIDYQKHRVKKLKKQSRN